MKTQEITKKRIIGVPFKEGNPGGPGRPKKTEEQRMIEKAVKDYIKDYEEGLAQALPKIQPTLIKKAEEGDIPAIKEIHSVIGAYKKDDAPNIAIQVNLNQIINKVNEVLDEK